MSSGGKTRRRKVLAFRRSTRYRRAVGLRAFLRCAIFHHVFISTPGPGIRVPVMGNQPREMSDKSLRLRAAVREDDGFFSTFVLRKISRTFTNALVETRIKPNTVTALSIALGLLAAYIASTGKYFTSGVVFLFSLVLDCVDGEIARYKSQFSSLGAWLDALADRVKEFAYIGALAYSTNDARVWWLAIALVILQTVRHLSDYNFVKLQKSYEGNRNAPIRSGVGYWVKKIINYPIGERWLLLSLLPLLISVVDSLRIILFVGILSFMYVIIARARRIQSWPEKSMPAQFLIMQRDTFIPLKISGSKISWTIPSFLRACELLALLIIPLAISPALQFLLITSVSLWHYTNLYDALQERSPRYALAGLRTAGRVGLCFIAYLVGFDAEIVTALAIYLGLLILLRGGHNVARGVA